MSGSSLLLPFFAYGVCDLSDISFIVFISLSCILLFGVFVSDIFRERSSYLASYICFLLLVSYVLAPFLMYFFSLGVNVYFVDQLAVSKDYFPVISAIVFLYFLSFFVGYFFCGAGEHKVYIGVRSTFKEGRYIFFIFSLAIIFFLGFVYLYGGVDYVLSNASRIRSGTDENKNYLGAFFKMFSYYIELVVFFVFAKLLLERKKGKKLTCLFFLVLLIIILFKGYIDAGRGGLLNVFIGLFFVYIFARGSLPFFRVFLIMPLALFVMIYGKSFIFQVYNGLNGFAVNETSLTDNMDFLLAEFSHQYLSLVPSVVNDLGASRFFIDFFVWIIKPLKLVGLPIEDSISYYNTYNINGVWDSEIPPGPIALFFYNGGVLLVMLGGLLSGFLLRWTDKLIINSLRFRVAPSYSLFACFAVLCIYLPFAYVNSDPALFVQWCLVYILLFLSMFFFRILILKKIIS